MTRWVCPYCAHSQIYTEKNSNTGAGTLWLGKAGKNLTYQTQAVLCLNEDCERITLFYVVYEYYGQNSTNRGDILQLWQLWPESTSKPQPDFIPNPIKNDYFEACLIRDKSPKAASTLARRCLQGMIRDFCGISKATLFKEIEALREQLDNGNGPVGVSSESVDAIDSVRAIGNIGAHMEKDINVIIDVDPDEAQVLIQLIETLFEDWYVARQKRIDRFARVKAIAAEKKAIGDPNKAGALPINE